MLSSELLSQFAKTTKDTAIKKTETIVYGTIVESNGAKYVQLDGSEILTPMASTTVVENGERVPVMIKNHMAIVTGNLTSPAIRTTDLDIAYSEISTELKIQDGKINSKVSQDDFNKLSDKVQSSGSEFEQTVDNIRSEVTKEINSSAETINQRIDGVANGMNNALDNVVSRVEKAEQKITSSAIVNTVRSSTEYVTDLAGKVDSTHLLEKYSTTEQTDDMIKMEVQSKIVGGTNMLRLSMVGFATSSGYSNGSMLDHSESYYCRSRKLIRMYEFSGDYNIATFRSIEMEVGKQYTVSFWTSSQTSGVPLMINIFNGGRGVDMAIGENVYTETNVVHHTRTFVCPTTDTYELRFINFGGHSGYIDIFDVKLEEGNTATTWSSHPKEFSTGSSVTLTEEQVRIVSPQTFIGIPSVDGEKMVAQFDENGATVSRLIANNVAYRYEGPSVVWINPNAETVTDEIYRSLGDLFVRLRGRILDTEMIVHMQGDDYGDIALTRVFGGSITIYGNSCTLMGSLSIVDCMLRVYVDTLNIVNGGSTSAAWVYGKGTWVRWKNCVFNGGDTNYALTFGEGGGGFVWDCGLYNAPTLLYIGHASDVSVIGTHGGSCTNFVATDGCTVKFSGTRPDGAWAQHNTSLIAPSDPSGLPVDYGTSQPSTPTIITSTYDFLYSDSYCTGWSYFSDNDIRQGYNGNRIYGVIWFDSTMMRNDLSGKTINQASLRLYMQDGIGLGRSVSVQLYGTNKSYDGRSGAPDLITSYGTIGTTSPGEVNNVTIPTAAVSDIVNGTIEALVLYSDDTAYYRDRGHSANYAKFDGSTSGDANTEPKLTVIYS